MVFENNQMVGKREIGIANKQNVLSMRKIDFEGKVPFYQSDSGHGYLVLLDSTLKGQGTENIPAISSGGMVNLRRVTVSGYGSVLKDTRKGGKDLPADGGAPTLVASHDQGFTLSGSGGKAESINLPIEEIPLYHAPKDAKWVDGGETSASLQAAIDSGAEWIYIKPINAVTMTDTVIVRKNVKMNPGLVGTSGRSERKDRRAYRERNISLGYLRQPLCG